MSKSWNNGKYQVISVSIVKSPSDDPKWRVELGIRRRWPLSWYDHRPWETFARREYPVRTFIGSGYAWFELKEGNAYGVGNLTPILNAIVSKESLKHLKHIEVKINEA